MAVASKQSILAELALLAALPQVGVTEGSLFDRAHPAGSSAQLRGAMVGLRCCGGQLVVKCYDLKGEKA